MRPLLIVLHIMICLILIVVVLLQAGRGANMGAMFGGSSQTVFGAAGAGTFLSKMTTVIAILFMLTTLGLSYFSQERASSVIRDRTPAKVAAEKAPTKDQGAPVSAATSEANTANPQGK